MTEKDRLKEIEDKELKAEKEAVKLGKLATFSGHAETVYTVVFSPDGLTLATGS